MKPFRGTIMPQDKTAAPTAQADNVASPSAAPAPVTVPVPPLVSATPASAMPVSPSQTQQQTAGETVVVVEKPEAPVRSGLPAIIPTGMRYKGAMTLFNLAMLLMPGTRVKYVASMMARRGTKLSPVQQTLLSAGSFVGGYLVKKLFNRKLASYQAKRAAKKLSKTVSSKK